MLKLACLTAFLKFIAYKIFVLMLKKINLSHSLILLVSVLLTRVYHSYKEDGSYVHNNNERCVQVGIMVLTFANIVMLYSSTAVLFSMYCYSAKLILMYCSCQSRSFEIHSVHSQKKCGPNAPQVF